MLCLVPAKPTSIFYVRNLPANSFAEKKRIADYCIDTINSLEHCNWDFNRLTAIERNHVENHLCRILCEYLPILEKRSLVILNGYSGDMDVGPFLAHKGRLAVMIWKKKLSS